MWEKPALLCRSVAICERSRGSQSIACVLAEPRSHGSCSDEKTSRTRGRVGRLSGVILACVERLLDFLEYSR